MKVKVLNIIDNKTFKGVATSYKKHAKYKKYVTSYKKYLVHFEGDCVSVGDEVTISETRPISKNKRWILSNQIKG